MEKVKLTLVLLFLVGVMFGQNTIMVDGVTFSYEKTTDTMKLLVPKEIITSEDPDWQKEIRISNDYDISMEINHKKVIMSDTFYYSYGRDYNSGSDFVYYFPDCSKCVYKAITTDSFELKHPPKGEYLLTVSDICDGKWVTNKKTGYIIIN